MPRRIKVIVVLAVLVVFSVLVRSHKTEHTRSNSPEVPAVVAPQPADAPTVATPQRSRKKTAQHAPARGKPKRSAKASSPAKDINSRESSEGEGNLSPRLRSRLKTLLTLYASWPGSTPKEELIKRLRRQEPFITESAVSKIATQWQAAPQTVRLMVTGVDLALGLVTSQHDPNNGSVTAYVKLKKHFVPVSGKPYTQVAAQPYTVKMQIINRSWRVTDISPQTSATFIGG
jgi:hypothetical protein